jgi:hypothetical protein
VRGSGCWRDSIVVFFIAASSVFVGTESAGAASITCPALIGNSPHIADNVTPSTGCEIGGTNNDFLGSDPTLFQVNVDAMFGFDDWQFAGKAFEAESGLDIGLSVTGGPISGTWSIDDVWTSQGISDLMLVFKGGVPKDPGNFVGYLIGTGATSGSYVTPFRTPTGRGGAADISHMSAYVRIGDSSDTTGDVTEVPEPASLLLFGAGLAMLARASRRKTNR